MGVVVVLTKKLVSLAWEVGICLPPNIGSEGSREIALKASSLLLGIRTEQTQISAEELPDSLGSKLPHTLQGILIGWSSIYVSCHIC
jgi:hypothetical protein